MGDTVVMNDRTVIQPSDLHQHRTGWRLPLLVIPLMSTAFGAVSGVTVDAVLPLAVFGLAWGLAAGAVAPRLARRGTRPTLGSDIPLLLAVALAFSVLGAGFLGNLLATAPQAQLDLLQQARFGSFFYAIHGPFEWVLMPLVVALNWHRPARRWLVVGAAVAFYAGRLSSAWYFAPHALAWGDDPATANLDEVQRWIHLNWIRIALQDTVTAVLLLLAAVRPDRSANRLSAAPALERAERLR
jgi:hypothetical protein